MLVECGYCNAIVDAQVLEAYESFNQEEGPPSKCSFLKCPRCESPFLILQEDYGAGWDPEPYRLYPPLKRINPNFPKPIKSIYEETLACFKSRAYAAMAIMCRKTIEGVCEVHQIHAGNLEKALKEMKDKGIIETRLFEWAELLRIFGNEAAHDVNLSVSGQDAKDIMEFTEAFLEYTFTFRDKFNEFVERRNSRKKNTQRS